MAVAPKRKRPTDIKQGINENSRPEDDDAAFAFAAEDLTFPDVALLWLQPIFIQCSVGNICSGIRFMMKVSFLPAVGQVQSFTGCRFTEFYWTCRCQST